MENDFKLMKNFKKLFENLTESFRNFLTKPNKIKENLIY